MTIGIAMDDLTPKVRSLLRIIQILNEEEQDQTRPQASRYYRRQSRERADDNRTFKPIPKDEDKDEKARSQGENITGAPSSGRRDRRSRRDNAMIRGRSADGRGRTPSPKRFPAPKPPSRDCSSPIPKMVSTNDVTPADQQGWLIDQLRGKKVWCVISDMLFCVFDKEDSKVSKQVILLPGCKVRQIEFKSASQEGKVLNGVARHFASTKTISGVDKYQFLIENSSNRQKLMFGVASKSDLEDWISALDGACCVDINTDPPDNENENDASVKKSKDKVIIRRHKSNSPRYHNNSHEESSTSPSSYSPAQTLPSRLDMTSFTLPTNHSHDVSKDTIDDIRKRLRKDNSETELKQIPMKVTHSKADTTECVTPSPTTKEETSGKGWGFSKLKSPLNLLRRKKRSSSADDAYRRRKMFPIREPDTLSNPGLSPRLSDSQPSLASSLGSNTSNSNPDSSFASSNDSKDSNKSKKRGFLSRSFDSDKNSKGTRASIRKSASELKDKIFGKNINESIDQSPRSRSAGIKLKDIENPSVTGFLQFRLAFKWTKVWCVLSRGCFYAFRTQKEEEFPVLALVLNQSTVSYVMDTDKQGKKLFAFKITQRHCKSVYICTDDRHTLMLWMKDLQTEAVRVQVDETLAIEIREKRSSQKKREVREMKEKEAKDKLDAKRQELQKKRNSCPDLSTSQGTESSEQHENESLSSKKESGMTRSSANVYMGDFTLDSGQSVVNGGDTGSSANRILDNSQTSSNSHTFEGSRFSSTSTDTSKESQSSPDGFDGKSKDNVIRNPLFNFALKQHQDATTNGHHTSDDTAAARSTKPYKPSSIKRSNSLTKDVKLPNFKPPESITSFSTFFPPKNYEDVSTSTPTLPPAPTVFHDKQFDISSNDSSIASPISPSSDIPSKITIPNDAFHRASPETEHNDNPQPTFFQFEAPNLSGEDEQNVNRDNDEIPEDESDIRQSVMDSLLHDDALKYTWSSDEDFLLGVIKDKLRKRRERLESSDNEFNPPAHDVNGTEAVIVYDGDGYGRNANFEELLSPRFDPRDHHAEDEDVFASPPGQDEGQDPEDSFMEGFLEKRGDNQWIKYWCSLKDGCLCFYVTPNDQISADTTDLTGYGVQQLVDRFQGKRFVLDLTHRDYVNILLSFDSRDELEVWYQSVNDIIASKAKRQQSQSVVQAVPRKPDESSSPPNGGGEKAEEAPSVQNVKHKLLAEMLRQKMELQKIRAARNGSRALSSPENPVDGTSSPSPMDDDRIRTLTRLRQRRMSTQIKMSAIQKQLDESSTSSKDKKAVFQLVRRKPDLVQSHSVDHTHNSELEQQVKRLSSQLQQIDSSISSHEVSSPRDDATNAKNRLRHSCDSAANQSATDSQQSRKSMEMGSTSAEDKVHDNNNKKKSPEKEKRKEKEVVRSNSIKSSMQQFAHRTFARAHWSKLRKNQNKSPSGKNDENNTINEYNNTTTGDNNFGSREKPPDVIDVTGNNNNNNNNNGGFSSQDWNIYAPPDSFRTDDCNIASDQQIGTLTKKHKTPKERILSKLSTSHSFTQIDKKATRLKPSSSSSSLFRLLSKTDNKKDTDSSSLSDAQNSPVESPSPVPKLNLNFDPDENDSSLSGNRSPLSDDLNHGPHSLYSQSSRADYGNSKNATHSNNRNAFSVTLRGSRENSSDSPRRENVRVRSGFYSARTEKTNPNTNRNSWSYGMMGSSRRQVNPNALAEIKAFEELSSKFLGTQDNS